MSAGPDSPEDVTALRAELTLEVHDGWRQDRAGLAKVFAKRARDLGLSPVGSPAAHADLHMVLINDLATRVEDYAESFAAAVELLAESGCLQPLHHNKRRTYPKGVREVHDQVDHVLHVSMDRVLMAAARMRKR